MLFTYFKNEWMLMAMFAMRKNNTEKAERYLMRIKDPDRALVRRERATYYFLIAALNSQKNLRKAKNCSNARSK